VTCLERHADGFVGTIGVAARSLGMFSMSTDGTTGRKLLPERDSRSISPWY
jgi:hypothetical protein